jgi:hypothetical protein
MENPSSWNKLIASLNIANAERDPGIAWSFLVLQGVVSGSADSYKSFMSQAQDLSTERQRQGPMTGPSFGAQLAPRLSALTLPAGRKPDPFGKIAKKRWEVASAWRSTPDK